MKKKKKLVFKAGRETHMPKKVVYSMPKSGPADEAVKDLLRYGVTVEADPKEVRDFLQHTGGWMPEELQDPDANIERLLWIACLDCQEQNTVYWYMGS